MYFDVLKVCRKLTGYVLLLGVLAGGIILFNTPVNAVAGINQQINFQGRLYNAQGAVVPDGFYNIQFKIYQDGDGLSVGNTTGTPAGSLKWTESYLNVNGKGVMVKNGFMSVQLGSVTPFGSSIDWNQDTLWLSLNIGNTNATCTPFTSCAPDTEMVPMKRMSANPYALNAGLLGGIASTGFLQVAQGVQIDASTNTNSIFINKTGTGNIINLQSAGSDVFLVSKAGDVTFGANDNHTISVAATPAGVAGKSLTIAAGSTTNTGIGANGGDLVLQGGNAAGSGDNNGGNITIAGGSGTGAGSKGLVNLSASAFTTSANDVCAVDCTITQSNIDNYSAVIVSASNTGIVLTLPAPTNTTTSGRIFYVTSNNTSQDFTLTTNTGIDTIDIAMRKNTTATMIWNGNNWTAGGVSTGALGGLDASQFVQLAQGVQTDASTNTSSIYINKTGTGNLVTLQSGSVDAFTIGNSGDIALGANSSHSISIAESAAGVAGKNLSISAGTTAASGSGAIGGNLLLQGGNAAGSGDNNGGDITVTGGAGTGAGLKGIVHIGPSAYVSSTNAVCAVSCTITQTNVDNFGTVVISASTAGIVITLPPPTNTALSGRILYITSNDSSQDFALTTNVGIDAINVAMRKNTTATMIWNGTNWTAGGASNATTLQAAYDNASNPDTTPEIKLDTTRGTIDIQDADVSINSDLLNIRGSYAGGLGTVLFGVSSAGRVTIQGTTDQYSAFRVLNSAGNYLFNINSSNNYVISNSIYSPGNELTNHSFETGGSVSDGEEGWFGPAQASIVNDAANAETGDYELQILPNGSNLDVYAGSYYEMEPGDSFYFEGNVKRSAGANGNAGIQITWYDNDKNVVGYSTDYGGTVGTTYEMRSVNGTVPASAHFARVSATVRSTANAGVYYFDDFYLKRSTESAPFTFRNEEDSTTAFRIQSAESSETLFTADTANNILKVGDSTGTDTATTLLVLDHTTADPTSLASKDGGLFYRSDNNSLKAVIGGAVVDICTTAVTCTGYSASAGSSVQLQGSTPGTAQTGNFNITGTGIMTQLQTQDVASSTSSNLVIRTGNSSGTGVSGNLTLDVGNATTRGTISIGHTGTSVATTMYGTLKIQGSNSLSLGTNASATGSILFNTSAGTHTIGIKAPGADPTASYDLTLPQVLGVAGDCLKDTGSGVLGFSDCAAGVTVTMQNAYDNSSPAEIILADAKDYKITSQQATTSANIVFDLQCTTSCSTNGRFKIQNDGVDVFTVQPNGGGINLAKYTQIGSSTTDAVQVNFQLDSYNGTTDSGACSTTVNQGAMYYNTSMGSLRSCINGSWGDVSNPDTLGLLTFGIVPSSGGANNAYDLPSLIIPGASGPCKVSFLNNNQVSIQPCIAYSNGRRVNVAGTTLSTNSASATNINLTTTARWGHICLNPSSGAPEFTTTDGQATAIGAMPAFDAESPILCLADVQGSATTAGLIDNIYDTRTFTTTLKEAVNVSTAVELGMLADAGGTNGALVPAISLSQKLYGLVVATDGATSAGAPNTIVASVGPGWVKANAGTAGQFIKTSTTNGYANTTTAIPNNSFYYSAGNTRTSYNTTCTSASTCSGSLYVNFIVR